MTIADNEEMILHRDMEDKESLSKPKILLSPQTVGAEFVFQEKPVYDVIKRFMDIILSLAAIVVLFVPMVIIAIVIVIDDFGNPIFVQKRTGKNGKEFWMFKFRSMYRDSEKKIAELLQYNEADGTIFKLKDDPRVTRIGKFIRRTSLDELPQIFNILTGTMSVVGPRPFVTYEQAKFNSHHSQRLLVTPGLTGLWQINGRCENSFDDLIELDLSYIRARNIWLDIKIILKTILAVFKGRGAY
jgi:lipopolysaccharide/colanic/teichoic acid biosynthesis glycosyltransferase